MKRTNSLLAIKLAALALLLAGCASGNANDLVGKALEQAGGNREELESVLQHYRQEGDGEKLHAAQFLIGNMQGLYGVDCASTAALDPVFNTLDSAFLAKGGKLANDSIYFLVESMARKHQAATQVVAEEAADLTTIKACDLIENIDLAFEAWNQASWHNAVNFDDFLEYVLPYRCSSRYSIKARRQFYNRYKPVLDTCRTMQAAAAALPSCPSISINS